MAKRSLYVCYVRLKDDLPSSEIPVFCYACSFCHAMNLGIHYCVEHLGWTLNSFDVSHPISVEHFIR